MNILSLDGGGIRGVLTAQLLLEIETRFPGFVDSAALCAGTSVGGLNALGIAAGHGPEALVEMYRDAGQRIFSASPLDRVADVGGLIGAQYDNAELRKVCQRMLGDKTLGDLERSALVTAFDLDCADTKSCDAVRQWRPTVFHNIEGAAATRGLPAWKAALYTSAAPTFFPMVDGFIDGGVFANNPSMVALSATQDERNAARPDLGKLVVLSVGTGRAEAFVGKRDAQWGVIQWVKPIINLMVDGAVGLADFQCRQILHDRYHRVDPVLPGARQVAMDDGDKVDELISFAKAYADSEAFTPTLRFVEQRWMH